MYERRPNRHGRDNLNKFYLLAAIVIAYLAWTFTPIADLVTDVIVEMIPVERDVELGRAAVMQARYRVLPDSNSVSMIGRNLVSKLPSAVTRHLDFQFHIIEEDYVNAFAYPGGRIFVTRRLIDDLHASRDEIAAVLAHEIGHVVSRHSQKQIIKKQVLGYILSALTREDGDGYRETFGENIHELLLGVASQFSTMSFSRSNEYEADNRGFENLLLAGMDPRGMISFFEKLQARTSHGSHQRQALSAASDWFSTHPHTEERIKALTKKLDVHNEEKARGRGGWRGG